MYIGKIEVVSFAIKSGRKLTISVIFEYQEMTKRKLFLLFPLFQVLYGILQISR
jgi:hypothetical protein